MNLQWTLLGALVLNFTLAAAFNGSVAQAARPAYDLKMNVQIDGQVVSAPHLVALPGEKATIVTGSASGTQFMEVTATETVKQGIMLKMSVGTESADGTHKVISNPTIVVMENEEALIEPSGAPGQPTLSIRVLATRTTF